MKLTQPTLEIAVTTVADAIQVVEGGAQSMEVSRELALGGLTPVFSVVVDICRAVSIPTYVIVRPHARDFIYTTEELDTVLQDIEDLKSLPIAGIVFGAQTARGDLDVPVMKMIARQAAPLPVTLHRALDMSRNPESALSALVGVIPRVLTAGPAPTAWEGQEGLRKWIQTYGDSFEFVSSGNLTLEQLPDYVPMVQADVYHFGSAARTDSMVDSQKVSTLLKTLQSVSAGG
ncbi:MAG: copper homeostasis protein CutC [Anaerolineae bacterium]